MNDGIYSRYVGLVEYMNSYNSIAVIGLGGVGSWTALLIALSGIAKNLLLIDGDCIEVSNLGRTPYLVSQIGRNKAVSMAEIIAGVRPLLPTYAIPIYSGDFSEIQQAKEITGDEVIIIDCRDTVDYNSGKSPIIVGYDKNTISISLNYKEDYVFNSSMEIREGGYTAAWVVPPVIGAALIVTYLAFVRDCIQVETKNISTNIVDMFNWITKTDILRRV